MGQKCGEQREQTLSVGDTVVRETCVCVRRGSPAGGVARLRSSTRFTFCTGVETPKRWGKHLVLHVLSTAKHIRCE